MKFNKSQIDNMFRKIRRIEFLCWDLKKEITGVENPLDDIFITEREKGVIKENIELKNKIKDLEKVNLHIESIYKRDLNKQLILENSERVEE